MSSGASMDVLVTGAAGKTGLAVVAACSGRGLHVTGLVRRDAQRAAVVAAGATAAVVVDLADPSGLEEALSSGHSVYHVPPNMHPGEAELSAHVIDAAERAGVHRFVLHSVLAPYLPAMPHHLRKAETERRLRATGLDWTILQPASYAQNVLPYLEQLRRTGVWTLPYRAGAPFTPVDLRDVAEVAARVLAEDGHRWASYELCGPDLLDSTAMAARLTALLGRAIEVKSVQAGPEVDPDLRAMFAYYDHHGLVGNPRVLAQLLERAPTPFGPAVAAMATSAVPLAVTGRERAAVGESSAASSAISDKDFV